MGGRWQGGACGQLLEEAAVGSVGSGCRQEQGLSALRLVADALERTGPLAEADEDAQLVGERLVLDGLATREDGPQLGRVELGARTRSMKRHLSHTPHQSASRAAGSWWKARLQLRKTRWYSGSAAKLAAIESSERSRSQEKYSKPESRSATRRRKPSSKSAPLLHWWLTGPLGPWVEAEEAERSFDMASAPKPWAAAVSTPRAERTPVTGTWPFR